MKCPKCGKSLVFIMSGRIYYGRHHPNGEKERVKVQQYECIHCHRNWLFNVETEEWTIGHLYVSKSPFDPVWREKEFWKAS